MHNTSGACDPRQKEISTKLLTKQSRTNDGERGVIVVRQWWWYPMMWVRVVAVVVLMVLMVVYQIKYLTK